MKTWKTRQFENNLLISGNLYAESDRCPNNTYWYQCTADELQWSRTQRGLMRVVDPGITFWYQPIVVNHPYNPI